MNSTTPNQHAPATGAKTGAVLLNAENGAHIDTLGTIFLGVALLIVLFAYMRAQGRHRKLLEELAAGSK
jgi:hypothetical protein